MDCGRFRVERGTHDTNTVHFREINHIFNQAINLDLYTFIDSILAFKVLLQSLRYGKWLTVFLYLTSVFIKFFKCETQKIESL